MTYFKPVPGYEKEYLVSCTGEVFSVRSNRMLTPKRTRAGYLRVGLSVNGRRKDFVVHRLVALAFILNLEGKPTVNHINENKEDNRVENLEWATQAEQNHHGTRTARAMQSTDWAKRTAKIDYSEVARKHDYASMNAAQMRKVVQLDTAGNVLATFAGIGQAARSVGASTGGIWSCCNGRRKTCKGSVWRYA